MTRKYVIPALAIIGLFVAILVIVQGDESRPAVAPFVNTPKVPFASYVAGVGMVETRTQNIAIGTPVPGIVTAIFVKWGQRVKEGDPLFKIDDRDLQAHAAGHRQGEGSRSKPGLVGARKQRRRDGEAKHPRGLQVNDQLKSRGSQNRVH